MKKLAFVLAVGVLALTANGCKFLKKKAGDSCKGDEATCVDKSTILECHDGKYASMTCKGTKGCSEKLTGTTRSGRNVTHNYSVSCDFSGAANADPCLDDDTTCSADKKTMVSCKEKKISLTKCLGPKGCVENPTTVDCDTSIMALGDTCEGDDVACAPDMKQFLKCSGGKLVLAQNCRGKKACYIDGRKIGCDPGDQNLGEPCSSEGNYDCQADKKALLKCSGGKWIVDQKCKKTCVSDEHEAGCK